MKKITDNKSYKVTYTKMGADGQLTEVDNKSSECNQECHCHLATVNICENYKAHCDCCHPEPTTIDERIRNLVVPIYEDSNFFTNNPFANDLEEDIKELLSQTIKEIISEDEHDNGCYIRDYKDCNCSKYTYNKLRQEQRERLKAMLGKGKE